MFDLCHGDYGEEFRKQEVTGKEQPECSEVKTNLENGWCVISTPATRKIIAVYRCNNNYKPLEPHTNIYNHRHEQRYNEVASHFSEPENLGRQHVTGHHQPV